MRTAFLSLILAALPLLAQPTTQPASRININSLISVKNFAGGATIDDGSTNATPAFQAAAAYAKTTTNACVFIPTPTVSYFLASPVTLSGGECFYGENGYSLFTGGALLTPATAAFATSAPLSQLQNFELRDVIIKGGVNALDLGLFHFVKLHDVTCIDQSGWCLSHVRGERMDIKNISCYHQAVNAVGCISVADYTHSIFSSTYSGAGWTDQWWDRSIMDHIVDQGQLSSTVTDQYVLWSNAGALDSASFSNSSVRMVIAHAAGQSATIRMFNVQLSNFTNIVDDGVGTVSSPVPKIFDVEGIFEYSAIDGFYPPFAGNSFFTESLYFGGIYLGSTIKNCSLGGNNSTTFGVEFSSNFGNFGSIESCLGAYKNDAVNAMWRNQITTIGSEMNPTNASGGVVITEKTNENIAMTLMADGNDAAPAAGSFEVITALGSGAFSVPFSVGVNGPICNGLPCSTLSPDLTGSAQFQHGTLPHFLQAGKMANHRIHEVGNSTTWNALFRDLQLCYSISTPGTPLYGMNPCRFDLSTVASDGAGNITVVMTNPIGASVSNGEYVSLHAGNPALNVVIGILHVTSVSGSQFVGTPVNYTAPGSFGPTTAIGGLVSDSVVNWGINGATTAAIITDMAPYWSYMSAATDVVLPTGAVINDVRIGTCSQTCANADVVSLYNAIRTGVGASADILWAVENSFLTVDVSGAGFLSIQSTTTTGAISTTGTPVTVGLAAITNSMYVASGVQIPAQVTITDGGSTETLTVIGIAGLNVTLSANAFTHSPGVAVAATLASAAQAYSSIIYHAVWDTQAGKHSNVPVVDFQGMIFGYAATTNNILLSGSYTSGGSMAGTGTCSLTSFNNGGTTAVGSVPITAGVITGGAAITLTNTGGGFTAAPTSATLGNGTGSGVCSGTAVVTGTIAGIEIGNQIHPSTQGYADEGYLLAQTFQQLAVLDQQNKPDIVTLTSPTPAANSTIPAGDFLGNVQSLGKAMKYSAVQAQVARLNSFTACWTFYNECLFDTTYYTPVAFGQSATTPAIGGGFIDIAWPGGAASTIVAGDVIYLPGGGSFQLPAGTSCFQSTLTVTRCSGLGGSLPSVSIVTNEPIAVFKTNIFDPLDIPFVLDPTKYTYMHRVFIPAAGTNFFRFQYIDASYNTWGGAYTTADVIVLDGGAGTLPLTGCSFLQVSTYAQCSVSGSFAAYSGLNGTIWGTHATENPSYSYPAEPNFVGGVPCGASGAGGGSAGEFCFPKVVARLTPVIGRSSTLNPTNVLYTAAPAGEYRMNMYVNQSAGCATVSTGSYTVSYGFTDSAGVEAITSASIPLATSVPTSTPFQLSVPIILNSASNITYGVTFTQCSVGTATYDLHVWLERTF